MNVTVYCGASLGNDSAYQTAAEKLGKWIADGQHTLVYGGGKLGLMGVVADTVLAHQGKVIGIIPQFLQDREVSHPNLTKTVVVESMSERKNTMVELGDAYIALPGGAGTLEEIAEVISWARIGKNNNPCILFNEKGYFDSLKSFFSHMVKEGFFTQSDFEKILFSNDLQEIETFIEHYQPPALRTY